MLGTSGTMLGISAISTLVSSIVGSRCLVRAGCLYCSLNVGDGTSNEMKCKKDGERKGPNYHVQMLRLP